jgi:hypothetical protein
MLKQLLGVADKESMTPRRSWLVPVALAVVASACIGPGHGGGPPG